MFLKYVKKSSNPLTASSFFTLPDKPDKQQAMSSGKTPVPYSLSDLPNGNTRAIYSVPSDIAPVVARFPIIIQGNPFEISSCDKGIRCEFFSPTPKATADAIGIRLASRLEDPSSSEAAATENCVVS